MKRILLAVLALVIAAAVFAKNKENLDYVIVKGNIHFGKTIHAGLIHTRLLTIDGQKLIFQNREIESVMYNGKLFELMPVVCQDKIPGKAMMELIARKDGLKLYRFTCCHLPKEIEQNCIDQHHPDSVYFVFRDGKYHLTVDWRNAENVLPFFGIPVVS